MSARPEKRLSCSYEHARSKEEAIEAARHATSCLEDLAGLDLGHDGNHLASEALKNIRAVAGFLRYSRNEAA